MPERGAACRRVDGVAQVVPASEPGGRRTRRSRPAPAAAPRPSTPTTRRIRATRMPLELPKKGSINCAPAPREATLEKAHKKAARPDPVGGGDAVSASKRAASPVRGGDSAH